MNLINCYEGVKLQHQIEQNMVSEDIFRGKISKKLFYKIHEQFGVSMVSFTNPQIDYISRQNYEIKETGNQDFIEFNFFLDCSVQGYQYWFEVELNIRKSSIRITCKVLKNGLSLTAFHPGLTQSLIYFALSIFPHFGAGKDESLRVNPIDGTIKYGCVNFFTRADFLEKLRHPAYLCEQLKSKISYMEEIMNKYILGKILEVYNQIPFSSIVPKNKQKFQSLNTLFEEKQVKRIARLQEQCRKTSEYIRISTYNVRQMNYNLLADDKFDPLDFTEEEKQDDSPIRFVPQKSFFQDNEKSLEKKYARRQNKFSRVKLGIELLPIFKLICNNAKQNFYLPLKSVKNDYVKQNEEKNSEKKNIQKNNPENLQKQQQDAWKREQIKKIRKLLKVSEYMQGSSNLISLHIWKVSDGPVIRKGFGGQISIVRCEYNFQYEVDQYQKKLELYKRNEIPVAPDPLIRKQFEMIRKYEDPLTKNRRLHREKVLINQFEHLNCLFIHRYYRCTFSPQAGISDDFQQDNLFMEFKNDKSLSTYTHMYSKILSLTTKLNFIFQILTGLRFLRDLGTFHLDIKPDNVLVRTNNQFYLLKLIDFGQSFTKTSIGTNGIQRGVTIPYASPEQQQSNIPTKTQEMMAHYEKSDVFGVGVIILTLIFDVNTSDMKLLDKKEWQYSNFSKFYSICAQKCRYYGNQEYMLILLNVAYLCIQNDKVNRPTIDWLTVIFKRLLFSLYGYHYQKNQLIGQ